MEPSKIRVDWQKGLKPEGITTIGDPVLKERCKAVSDFSAASDLVSAMKGKLDELKGAGLAAPQIGVPLRVAIVEIRKSALAPDRPETPLYVLVNPEVTPIGSEMNEDWEGCFSIPGMMGRVPRYSSIQLRYQGLDGAWKEELMDGYLARVVQHECDHLDGILYFERMKSSESLTTIENYEKFHQRK